MCKKSSQISCKCFCFALESRLYGVMYIFTKSGMFRLQKVTTLIYDFLMFSLYTFQRFIKLWFTVYMYNRYPVSSLHLRIIFHQTRLTFTFTLYSFVYPPTISFFLPLLFPLKSLIFYLLKVQSLKPKMKFFDCFPLVKFRFHTSFFIPVSSLVY